MQNNNKSSQEKNNNNNNSNNNNDPLISKNNELQSTAPRRSGDGHGGVVPGDVHGLNHLNNRGRPHTNPPFSGDFSGDLDPYHPLGGVRPAGNLMGPGHPLFSDGDHHYLAVNNNNNNPNDDYRSGFGMRPRFDPFGPPGGPQQVAPPPGRGDNNNNNDGRGRHCPGEPNPDHLAPPDDLRNNDFSY
ncbi:expressed unknown protein [Seminavis robusta]|uniref:Uncharacterized protein n=1 Tax=Seminavis robusta TaxID=568900 RepID=A0A9N8HQ28_9STRA|nr:expressed unknown protein [Seminavis robusta]|eukprot:Sro1392_g268880.1 n/a (187) ;mRNA; r:26409-26969